jgi:hypothetical protein
MIRYPHLSIEESCEHQSTRVCIATYEILGPSQNGRIGTAYFSLATTLASAGHDVTILYLSSERSEQTAIEHWISHFRTLGIRFVALPHAQRTIKVPQCMLTSRDAYTWLQKQIRCNSLPGTARARLLLRPCETPETRLQPAPTCP